MPRTLNQKSLTPKKGTDSMDILKLFNETYYAFEAN